MYNVDKECFEIFHREKCETLVWDYSPHAQGGQSTVTSSQGYSLAAQASIQGLTGSASYSSTFAKAGTIPHTTINPSMNGNAAEWSIKFNNLDSNDDNGNFSPEGSFEIDNLRWIWRVNHGRAIREQIYTRDGNKLFFHFKISLRVIFAQISPKIPKETDYLDVFDSNDNVVFELPVPPPSTYKITKNVSK